MKKQRLNSKRALSQIGLVGFIVLLVFTLLPIEKVYAAETGKWLNADKIQVGDKVFKYGLPVVGTRIHGGNIFFTQRHEECEDIIGGFRDNDRVNDNGDLRKEPTNETPVAYLTQTRGPAGCRDNPKQQINLTDRWNRVVTFSYQNQYKIIGAADQPAQGSSIKAGETFTRFDKLSPKMQSILEESPVLRSKKNSLFFRDKETKPTTPCVDYVEIGGTDEGGRIRKAKLVEQNRDTRNRESPVRGCRLANGVGAGNTGDGTVVNVWINGLDNASRESGGTLPPGTPAPTTNPEGEGGDGTPECDFSGNPLTWIVCPVVLALMEGFRIFDNWATNLLTIDTITLFETDLGQSGSVASGLHAAWSGFRYIALGLLVVFALVMIISQAIGSGPFDAYTIKRVMPRLLAAIVLIALSWELMKFAIALSNGVGHAVGSLIYGPFSRITGGAANLGSADTTGVLAVVGTGALFGLGIMGALSFLLTAMIAVLVALAVLVFREMLIIFLVVVAPIALVCNILPNTQRAWKMWSDYFLRALLVFPIFTGMVAIGRSFAQIAASLHGGGIMGDIIALIAYVTPYFLLPALFKWSGGAIAAVAGFAAGATSGMRGGLSKYRANKFAERRAAGLDKAQKGELFGRGRFRGLSSAAQRAVAPTSLIPGRLGAASRGRLANLTNASMNDAVKELQAKGLLDDTAGNEFIQHGHTLGALQKRVKQLRADGEHGLAAKLEAYSDYAGQRGAQLGAAKINASFGKLSDRSLESLDTIFGSSPQDRAAKENAFGDLVFTSKGAGNYVTYAARIDKNTGRVMTYSNPEFNAEARENMAKSLMEAGPNVISSIKPYTDKGSGVSVKQATAEALVSNAVNAPDASGQRKLSIEEHARAMETFVQSEMEGAYNDTNMKAAFDRAMSAIQTNPEALAMYNETRQRVAMRGRDDQATRTAAGIDGSPPPPSLPGPEG